jgi:hypothetical protein
MSKKEYCIQQDHTDPKENHGAEAWRAPDLSNDDHLIFDECGRSYQQEGASYGVTYQSHYYRVVKAQFGGYAILVKHGGGQERIELGHDDMLIEAMAAMDTHTRYRVLHSYLRVVHAAQQQGIAVTATRYHAAFLGGKLKKRKIRGTDTYKVSIDD